MVVTCGDSSKVQDQLSNVQQIHATDFAFAAIRGDGSVVTWGHEERGAKSDPDLRNVLQLQASEQAFAALRADGMVVSWGNPDYGGDSSQVQEQLKNL